MRSGLLVANIGEYADPRLLAELAAEAEAAGWDGFFLWDLFLVGARAVRPALDPWVALAAVAMRTERLRIGPLVTALPRRRPWQVAREAATLDRLSNGRLVFGIGSGDAHDRAFSAFGEAGRGELGARTDEALEIIRLCWRGEAFSYEGVHYQVKDATILPTPAQARVPVWVGGYWPHRRPFRRAARCDGAVPLVASERGGVLTPELFGDLVAFVRGARSDLASYDLVASGRTDPTDLARVAELLRAYRARGATWFLETIDPYAGELAALRQRVRHGPIAI